MYAELLGQILLKETSLTPEDLERALRLHHEQSRAQCLGKTLLELGTVTEEELAAALAKQWGLRCVAKLEERMLRAELVQKLPVTFLQAQEILPIQLDDDEPAVAVADPLNGPAYDAVLQVLGRYAPRVVCPAGQIAWGISQCHYQSNADGGDAISRATIVTDDILQQAQPEDLLNIANQAPIVKLVNQIFFQAVNNRASDIHIEPYADGVKVRYRIDGILHDVENCPRTHLAALVSRIKIMANLDIAERRLPQDGQSRIKIGVKEMDIRCSVIPTAGGERVVLRLLDKGGHELGLEHTGFSPGLLQQFRQLIHRPNGIVLITGPTGSGKTTTLYSVLTELNNQERNILTVEDPIEYQLPGVGQMQIKPKIGLTFANCLRHILRQDPDVIMVGEIRDEETARIAVQASLTGHLVLSTLHTNDAASAASRLLDMDIEPYLLASSISAIMAQRLVRRVCPDCKTPASLDDQVRQLWLNRLEKEEFSGTFYQGTGCERCVQTGYFGRTGIFELLIVDEDIKELITRRAAAHVIREMAVTGGMVTLQEDGAGKALQGLTSLDEVIRVTQDQEMEAVFQRTQTVQS